MNFANLTGLSDSYGNVTQIADATGNVLWRLETNKPVILQVEKITATTYAGETTYENEQFVLLNIYPKTNGIVNVTYGGLTKTITDTSGAEVPNAQSVFFGTFNGVSDSVTTPASGTLTIEGDYDHFSACSYQTSSKAVNLPYCGCITDVIDWGNIANEISNNMFTDCTSLALTSLPSGVTSIGNYAFDGCTNLALTSLPSGITSIGNSAFYQCTNLALTSLPSGITSIGNSAFYECTNLALTSLPSGITSIGNSAFYECTNLALTSLPSGLVNIEGSAFYRCASIDIQNLPEGLLSIKDQAFAMTDENSTAMKGKTITLPSTLQSIGKKVFAYTTANSSGMNYDAYVGKVIMRAITPPTASDESLMTNGPFGIMYSDVNSIVVPSGCKNAYNTAPGWKLYSSFIVEA